MNKFGLTPEKILLIRHLIESTLASHQKIKIWIFGSRVSGAFRPYSDVDLLLEAAPPLTSSQISEAAEKLDESNLPFKIDLVRTEDLHTPYAEQIHTEKK